jgi:hypothetical protein
MDNFYAYQLIEICQLWDVVIFVSLSLIWGKIWEDWSKKCKTQNPCLKSNSVAWIWTSLWLHCFSWSESLVHEIHPTFWGWFVFTSFFFLIYFFFFSLFSLLFLVFLFFTNTIVVLFFDLGFDWKYVGVDDFFFYVYVWFTNVFANCFFFNFFLSYVLISRLW